GMLGVELVVAKEKKETKELSLLKTHSFKLMKEEGSKLYFDLDIIPSISGSVKLGLRVFPVNKDLPHRMDFAYLKWIQI
ncbi:hypothetical protein, partial [Macellibacteroides fermentans]